MTITATKEKMNELLFKELKDDFGIVIPKEVTVERFELTNCLNLNRELMVGPTNTEIRITKHVKNKAIALNIFIQEE